MSTLKYDSKRIACKPKEHFVAPVTPSVDDETSSLVYDLKVNCPKTVEPQDLRAATVQVDTKTAEYRRKGTLSRMSTRPDGIMHIKMPYSFSFSCDTSGVVAGSLSISPDKNTAEWADLADLYDQYRVRGGEVRYFIPAPCPNPSTSGLGANQMAVVAYDPSDASALANVRQGCELAQHTLTAPSLVSNRASPTGSADPGSCQYGFLHANGKPYVLWFTTPRGGGLSVQSGSISYSPGMWKSTEASGSNNPDGQLKCYFASAFTSSAVCITGIIYMDVEFRRRK